MLSNAEIELVAQKNRNRALFETIAAAVSAVVRPLSAWWARTQVHDELMSMDDRMLADIGISRADVPAVAAGRYQGHPVHAPRLVAGDAKRIWRSDFSAAHNDQATRVA
jgi:uncharacterized protein YjiS (DUF1127 family)